MITNEKEHAQHPSRTYIRWIIFYIIIALIGVWGLSVYGKSLHTMRIPDGVITLDVPYKEYLVGENITFTLTNHYNSTLYVPNHCPSEPLAVYKLNSKTKEWERIHETATRECDDQSRQFSIEPGESIKGNYGLWPKLFATPGTYRIAAVVDYVNAVSYQDFKVIKKPVAKIPASSSTSSTSSSSSTTTSSSSTTQTTPSSTTTSTATTKTISVSGGTVKVSYTSTTITVLSVVPNSGCSYEKEGGGSSVEIQFKCGELETQLKLYLSGGQLVQRVEQDN